MEPPNDTNRDAAGASAPLTLTGIPTAPGIAIGRARIHRHDTPQFREYSLNKPDRQRELDRLQRAIQATTRQLNELHDRLIGMAGETVARIFEAQGALMQDVEFIGAMRGLIDVDGINAEAAVNRITRRLAGELAGLGGEVFRQKAQDINDVGLRLIRNLLGTPFGALERVGDDAVIVADDLLPSDVVLLGNENILAVATELGATTSHTAILTRALEVPAVIGLKGLTNAVANGEVIIVNGNSGKVHLRPNSEQITGYRVKRDHYRAFKESLRDLARLPAETIDGRRIALRANIELPHEVRAVLAYGGEGVGLFRSEYLFLAEGVLPDEEEQFRCYRTAIQAVAPHPMTIRTFDLGGDKVFRDLPHPVEANPFLGWRAIRVSLDQPEMLHTQLRAILRAAVHGKVRMMFPLVSGVREIREIKRHLEQVKRELSAAEVPFNPSVEVGIMIELPSAVILADLLAREVDYFSIGTNDLTQFALAVDRGNERVAAHYRPMHPALLRMIGLTVRAGHLAGIEVAMCGELAANPLATMLLVGLGLDELSVSPVVIPEVKKLVRSMSYREAVEFARQMLKLETAEELVRVCRDAMKRRFADLPIWFNGEV